jgi:hypothetical protein
MKGRKKREQGAYGVGESAGEDVNAARTAGTAGMAGVACMAGMAGTAGVARTRPDVGNPYEETMPAGSRVQLTCGVRETQNLTFIPKGTTGTIVGYRRAGIGVEDTRWLLSVRLDRPVKDVQVLQCWPAEVRLIAGPEPTGP